MPPFIIYSLPRSRTFWLSRFLTYGDWVCGHDEARRARGLDDVRAWFEQPNIGTVETAVAPWWRLVQKYQPDIRTVVVRRPVAEVVDSLLRAGLDVDPTVLSRAMSRLDRKLDQIERRAPNALSVRFADLESEGVCAEVFEYCLPYRRDPAWWSGMAPLNMQISLPALVRYCRAFQPQLDKLAAVAKQRILTDMTGRTFDMEGVTIQQEPFEVFFRDGQQLFAEHLSQVGEAPGAFWDKNLPLMRAMDGLGAMQVTTARSNGRMFGYLMAIVSPSLESPDVTSAMHMTFYASKDIPGLGMKLQKASIAGLRTRGVDELFLRAGTRGAGPKMSSLYRRLGAEDFGQLFKLELRN